MPCAKPLALIAACLTTACATSTPPSTPPTPMPRPEACATPCPPLPALTSPDEPAAVIWTFELIDTAGQCMRLHDACRGAR